MSRCERSISRRGRWIGPIVTSLALLLLVAPISHAGPSEIAAPPIHALTVPTEARASPHAPAAPSPEIVIHLPTPTWVNVTSAEPGAAPPIAEGGSAAYDPIDNESVYFGGCLQGGACPSNQTWVFAHGVWTNVTDPYDAPPARTAASMDYDANMRAVLLFGGDGAGGVLRDTWIFTNDTWTNVTFVGAGPPALEGASLSFDPQPEENGSVLFGGCAPEFIFLACSNETWVWQGWSGWVRLPTSIAPPLSGYGAMAYDPSLGVLVLFGGYGGVLNVFGGTWELYSGQWWPTDLKVSPQNLTDAGLVYDPGLDGLVLFGGINASFVPKNDTWLFSAKGWSSEAPALSPPARSDFGLSLEGTGTTPIVVGGENTTQSYGDTWAYEFPPSASLSFNLSTTEVGEGVTVGVSIGGGTAPYNATVVFGDGARAFVSGPGPTLRVAHAYSAAGTYPVSVSATDAVGASVDSGPIDFPVSADPSITAFAVPSSTDVGAAVSFSSAILSDGAPPMQFFWNFGDGSPAATGATPSHSYAAPGTYRVTVNGTNADHIAATASLTVTVAADLTILVAAAPSTVDPGAPTTFFANITGGTAPFAFAWVFAPRNLSAFPSPVHRFAAVGTYTIDVWVNDSVGGSAHGSVVVTVTSPTSPTSSGLGAAPLWFWGGLGALAAVAAAGSVVMVRTGRARPPKP
ncbi:MAG: PKD domain-containing protein [Thermoplasmata archaeon]